MKSDPWELVNHIPEVDMKELQHFLKLKINLKKYI